MISITYNNPFPFYIPLLSMWTKTQNGSSLMRGRWNSSVLMSFSFHINPSTNYPHYNSYHRVPVDLRAFSHLMSLESAVAMLPGHFNYQIIRVPLALGPSPGHLFPFNIPRKPVTNFAQVITLFCIA